MRSPVASLSCLLLVLGFSIACCGGRAEAQGFGAPVLVPTGGQPPFNVFAGDFDGDGKLDLLSLPTVNGQIVSVVEYGDGKGNFAQSGFAPFPIFVPGSIAFTAADVNHDGKADVVWGQGTNVGTLGVNYGSSDRQIFGTESYNGSFTLLGGNPPNFTNITAVDLNGDGMLDSVVVDSSNNYLYALLFEPAKGLNAYALGSAIALPDGGGPVYACDLNGDGFQDLVVQETSGSAITVLLGHGDGTFGAPTRYALANGIQSMLLHDMNGDGRPDLVVEDAYGRIQVFAGNGDGTFGTSSIGGTTSVDDSAGDGGYLIAAADLNGDGKQDLLTYTPLGVSVELGQASGNYTLQGVYSAGAGTHSSFATGDFNGDGALDVAMDAPGGIVVLFGKSAGTSPGVVSATPEPAAFEAAYSLIATLAAGPGPGPGPGTVAFTVDGAAAGSAPVMNGVATLAVAAVVPGSGTMPLLPGSHAVGGTFMATNSALAVMLTSGTHVVSLGTTSVVLTPTTPQTVYYGGAVNGTFVVNVQDPAYPATGTWTLLDNGIAVPICTGLQLSVNGVPGNCPYGYPILLNAGPHAFAVAFNGDAVNAASVSPAFAYTVLPDPTVATVTSSGNPALVGSAVTFTAAVTVVAPGITAETPVGTLSFMDGPNLLASMPLNGSGTATYTTSTLSLGPHSITAVYTPAQVPLQPASTVQTQDFLGATSAALQQVIAGVPVGTVTTLTSNLNPSAVLQTVRFTATVQVQGSSGNQIQSGVVTFLDGTTPIGTGLINALGMAEFSTSALDLGSHAITASYPGGSAGTTAFAPSVSPVLTQVVLIPLPTPPPQFLLTVSPNPAQVRAGQTGIFLVTVTEVSGYSSPVALSCSGLPYEAKCVFAEPVTPAGGGATTLELATMAPHQCGNPANSYAKAGGLMASCLGAGPGIWASARGRRGLELVGTGMAGPVLAGLILLLPRRRFRVRRGVLLAVAMLAGMAAMNGCGGNCTDLGIEPGDYTFTVTATPPLTVTSGSGSAAAQTVKVKLTVLAP